MSSVLVAGACGKLRQKVSTSAAVIRAASMRDGMFSNRLMVVAAFRHTPHRQLEQQVEAQGVAVVGVLVAAGDGQHPKAQHLGQGMGQSRL